MFVEHIPKETPEKSRETAWTLMKTGPQVVGNTPAIESFFKIFRKGGKGDREERQPFVFDTSRGCFYVARGACVTCDGELMCHHTPEFDQAFHHRLSVGW